MCIIKRVEKPTAKRGIPQRRRVVIRFFKKIISLALLIVLLLPALPCGKAAEQVRVGFYEHPNMLEKTTDGYCGYACDYLRELQKYGTWEHEFVPLSYEEGLRALAAGEIDLLFGVRKSDAYASQLLFGSSACGVGNVALYTRSENTSLVADTPSTLANARIGVLSGSADGALVRTYCEEQGVAAQIKQYSSMPALIAALAAKELDAIAGMNLSQLESLRPLAHLAQEPYYIAVNPKRPDLVRALNQRVNRLHSVNPSFETTLKSLHFPTHTSSRISYTAAEQNYLSQRPTVRVAYISAWSSLSYQDKNGAFRGIIASVFSQIEQKTGIYFEFRPYASYRDQLAALQKGDVDMLSFIAGDSSWAAEVGATLSNTYMMLPTVRVYKKGQPQSVENRIAVLDGTLFARQMAARFPSSELIAYPNTPACIKAVENGEVDAAFTNLYVMSYHLQDPKYRSLEATALTGDTLQLAFGYRKASHPSLITAVDKALNSITENELTEIILSETIKDEPLTLSSLIYQYPIASILVISLFMFAMFIMYVAITRAKARHREEIKTLTYVDLLSSTPNLKQLKQDALLLLQSQEKPYALVYLNILHFKNVNETFGYPFGDRLLKLTAQLLHESLAKNEQSARVHSDHFAALLQYDTQDALTQRILAFFNHINEQLPESCRALRFAAGVYCIPAENNEEFSSLLDRAKYACDCVTASEGGMVYYNAELHAKQRREQELLQALPLAEAHRELRVVYQPQVNCYTGATMGVEALVRWQHHSLGLIMPGEFVPLAERNGTIREIDFYVFRSACQAVHDRIRRLNEQITLSCNFSRLHIDDEQFVPRLRAIADECELPHSLIEIEITETVALENTDALQTQLAALKEAGFRIAIDDFGSGYSSLGLLTAIPCDIIKLDRSFLQRNLLTETDRLLLSTIINLCAKTGKRVICEGVETKEQLELLRELHCITVQGYYYSKPCALDEIPSTYPIDPR